MPDIVLGALIGMAGVIVGAVSSYLVTRIQTKARHDELIQELSHQEREAKINRLINSREKILIPLRETMTDYLELNNKHIIMMIRMVGTDRRGDPDEQKIEAIQLWKEASQNALEALANFEILRSQISDTQLYQLIEEVMKTEENERPRIMNAVKRVQDTKNTTIEIINETNMDIAVARKRIFDKLLPMNKRIEQLLAGETSSP